MPTTIIVSDSTDANGADITLTDGARTSISLFDPNGGEVQGDARVALEIKDAGGNYTVLGYLTKSAPASAIVGPGTFRARRLAGTTAVGVNRD